MTQLTISSPAFRDGEPIPDEYGYTERNVNPPFRISGVPEETETLALVIDDPDAVEPAGKVWDHWVVWNVPPEREKIPEGWDADDAVEGRNDYGERGYGGPNPPDREHTYRIHLYAADTELELGRRTDADDLRDALEGHVIDEATLEGTYAP
ncbi:YbhB/YbcL family Raf kinase inhibitor-like protein [Halapricum hydrolyticum]|uniref:YbhB/YbcL family Raf kinase inhibitor-like protein n=1 Tax=Halapricum hydrolyticum TaxID=2979991 RepID=A0AAE3ICV7_9EURY|nr:YbhB/YbcL family Raf kinase inhibitor-like protein [Halapricum hydrolyticum]MCU4719072.1 YbhB/YbcL family Raf kinase inhibitor-like protein [Halapricum hydrolyticum]MCU4728061.1 YbhB/YbcL family Raf kinase inhibitor-like protein [Halapricum hydrolyticum]